MHSDLMVHCDAHANCVTRSAMPLAAGILAGELLSYSVIPGRRRTYGLPCKHSLCDCACAGEKKSTKEKRALRKAKKKDPAAETGVAVRRATPEELSAAGARLGPRAQVCLEVCQPPEV